MHHHHAFKDPEQLAKKWNTSDRDEWQRPQEIVKALELHSGAVVADVGAGTGYLIPHLSQAVGENGTVIALDTERAMVDYLAKRKDFGPSKVAVRQAKPNDPGLSPSSVDAVVTLDTWHHIGNQEAYAQSVYKAVKKGGRFVVVDYDESSEVGPPQRMRISPSVIVKQLESAGFRSVIAKERMPRHYIVVGHKD